MPCFCRGAISGLASRVSLFGIECKSVFSTRPKNAFRIVVKLGSLVSPDPRPNVRAKQAPAAGRHARAGENVRVPPARAWWPAVGAPLERGVRPQRCYLHLSFAAMYAMTKTDSIDPPGLGPMQSSFPVLVIASANFSVLDDGSSPK